jgi:hypothetical protein
MAMQKIALFYEKGFGIQQNYDEALLLYTKCYAITKNMIILSKITELSAKILSINN